MEIRNVKYNKQGTIDCEIDHPELGWIPFTASPDDVEQHGKDIHAFLIESENIAAYVVPAKTTVQIEQELTNAKESQKDILRREKLDSMLTMEFADIDSATDNASVKAVGLRHANP